MVHLIRMGLQGGYLGELDIFNQPCGNVGVLPFGEIDVPALFTPIQDAHLQKRVVVIVGPLILVTPDTGATS